MSDIYFNPDYVSLYLKPGDTVFQFNYKDYFKYIAIKTGDKLKTAYGYGGYQISVDDVGMIQEASFVFKDECLKQGITTNVILWHPQMILNKFLIFNKIEHNRDLAVADLTKPLEYSATIRNVLKGNKESIMVDRTDNIGLFYKLYTDTMLANQANEKYFFSLEYFKKLLLIPGVEMYWAYNKQSVALSMGIFFMTPPWASYHLAANNKAIKTNANYLLLDYAIWKAKSLGIKYLLLGGGLTPEKDDNLFKFKMKFTKTTMPFYITEQYYGK